MVATEGHTDATDSPRKRGAGGAALREFAIVVVGALLVSILLRAFVGQMFIIPSQSMENTLLIGDRVVVEKITGFERGDVVVFSDPGGWLGESEQTDPTAVDRLLDLIGIPTAASAGHLIKRVIGMPGDRVVCCDTRNRITVNGYPLDETSYLYTAPDGVQVAPSEVRFTVVVPKDRIFVMGDHRDLSADSRCHLADLSTDQAKGQVAFVPENLVVGPTVAIAWPLSRFEFLHRPATFAGVPPPTEPAPERGVIEPEGVSC
ncbi:MAG TPA: signal peptidase I [Microlunatus sp.]|nr:signal peptidase I [Microlunatus sp.]